MIPRSVLFGNPERGAVSISPDGRWLAWSASTNGVMNMWVCPRDGSTPARQLTFDTHDGIGGASWTRDSAQLLFGQDTGGDEDYRLFAVDVASGEHRCLTPDAKGSAGIVSISRKHPSSILISSNERDRRNFDLYTIDLVTGARTLVFENPGFRGFIVDDDYNVRYTISSTPDGGRQLHERAGDDWKVISVIGPEDARTSNWFYLSADGRTLYGVDSRGRDKAALVAMDTATHEVTVIAQSDVADLGGSMNDPLTYRPVLAWVNWLRSTPLILDDAIAQDVEFLDSTFAGEWSLSSRTADNKLWLVVSVSDTRPATTYLYDRDQRSVQALVVHKPAMANYPLARMQPVVIKSRDGLDLVSYLTLPRAADTGAPFEASEPVPLVLVVHGGPWMRDGFGLNTMHQWLADRGYAVLAVNFRGSTGFGKAFINAADRQWGRKMSDDLEDAVDWAIAKGIADPARLAIMGGSYGGFAVLSALTERPGRYCCGIDIFGPSNVQSILEAIPPHWEHERKMLQRSVGDPTTEAGRAELKAISPIHKADAIRAPLLVAQGANDPRVKQSESDGMVQQLVQRGIPVDYVLFTDEGHGFGREPNRLIFNAVTEAFLAKHLGGPCEPFKSSDFPGNSMKVMNAELQALKEIAQ